MVILLFILSVLLGGNTPAQSLKKPSPAEQAILDKAIPIIQSVLDRFGDNDWSLNQDWYNGEPYVPISDDGTGPIGIDQNFEREYQVQENSKRFNTIIMPLNNKLQELNSKYQEEYQAIQSKSVKEQEDFMSKSNPTMDSITAIGDKAEELNEIDVYAYVNTTLIKGKPVNDPGINVRGASLVTKLNHGYYQKDNWISYFLAFGNWKGLKYNNEFNCYYYKFRNTKTSSIQNIVIVMTGAPDRMKELMNKIDWSVLNKALTE